MPKEQVIIDFPIGVDNGGYISTDDYGFVVLHTFADSDQLDAIESLPASNIRRRMIRWREKHGQLPPGLRNHNHKFMGTPAPKEFPLPAVEAPGFDPNRNE